MPSKTSPCNGVPFADLCQLLDKLEQIHDRTETIILHNIRKSRTDLAIVDWFRKHKNRINEYHSEDSSVLMLLKPEHQTDRDYGVEQNFEENLVSVFGISPGKLDELKRWRRESYNGDLGSRLCRILREDKDYNPDRFRSLENQPSIRDIDQKLLRLAIPNKGSSEAVKSLARWAKGVPDKVSLLKDLYHGLMPNEAKWVTRMIQKSFGAIQIPGEFGFPDKYSTLPNCISNRIYLPTSPQYPALLVGTRLHSGVGSNEPGVHIAAPGEPSQRIVRCSASSANVQHCVERKRKHGLVDPMELIDSPPNKWLAASDPCHNPASGSLQTPPTSLPSTPNEVPAATGTKSGTRFRIRMDPNSLKLAPPARVNAPLTPNNSSPLPASSSENTAVAAKTNVPPTAVESSPLTSPPAVNCRKDKNTARSRGRCSIASQSGSPSTRSSQRASQHASAPVRPALNHISSNILSRSQQSQSRCITNDTKPSSSKTNPLHSVPFPVRLSSGKCAHLIPRTSKHRCRFASALLILSPCVTNVPYIIENLILPHGAHYTTSLAQLSHPSIPRRTKSGRRIKKYVLVEINRPEETLSFCKTAERNVRALGWKSDRGYDEHIEIYDWRVLEDFAKLDRGEALDYNPLLRHWQGTI